MWYIIIIVFSVYNNCFAMDRMTISATKGANNQEVIHYGKLLESPVTVIKNGYNGPEYFENNSLSSDRELVLLANGAVVKHPNPSACWNNHHEGMNAARQHLVFNENRSRILKETALSEGELTEFAMHQRDQKTYAELVYYLNKISPDSHKLLFARDTGCMLNRWAFSSGKELVVFDKETNAIDTALISSENKDITAYSAHNMTLYIADNERTVHTFIWAKPLTKGKKSDCQLPDSCSEIIALHDCGAGLAIFFKDNQQASKVGFLVQSHEGARFYPCPTSNVRSVVKQQNDQPGQGERDVFIRGKGLILGSDLKVLAQYIISTKGGSPDVAYLLNKAGK